MSNEKPKVQGNFKDAQGSLINFYAEDNDELAALYAGYPFAAHAQLVANLNGAAALGQIAQPEQSQQAPQQQQGWGQTPAAQQQSAAPVQQGPKLHPTDTCAACGQRPQEKDVFRKSDNKKFEFWTCPNQKSRDDGHYSAFRN